MSNILFELSDAVIPRKITLSPSDSEEAVVGGIITNRIVGIAYKNLDTSTVSKESRNALGLLKKSYEAQHDLFIDKLSYMVSILKNVDFKYAFLKGSYLTPALYKRGERISNDIDLLINSDDISKIQTLLTQNGFIQGSCNSHGEIVPATRREIVEAKMNFGETIPFFRYYNNELLEIDLNFSVDYKAKGGGNIVRELLNRTQVMNTNYMKIQTLEPVDFLIHLCCHLFKEATTYDWVVNRRDLMLYKFSDINLFVNVYGSTSFFGHLMNRIQILGTENACYYTFLHSSIIYPHINSLPGFRMMLEAIRPMCTNYLKQIIHPRLKEVYSHTLSFEQWFKCSNRISMLSNKKGQPT